MKTEDGTDRVSAAIAEGLTLYNVPAGDPAPGSPTDPEALDETAVSDLVHRRAPRARAFSVGDRANIGDRTGGVLERTLLVTRVRTIKNVAVTIPNGNVLSGHLINYTALAATRGLVLHTTITIGDFYVSYQLNGTTDRPDIMAGTCPRLHQEPQESFNSAGLEIMSPHYRSVLDGGEATIPVTHRPSDYAASPLAVRISQPGPRG
ncbi:MAG: mechanosensitive ion channel domain-containing protein [Gemmatimonadaceae bacterium]